MPQHYRDRVDVRTFGTGERIVSLPYPTETVEQTHAWFQDPRFISV